MPWRCPSPPGRFGRPALNRVGVVRYDAFDEVGGRMSFSAALLDDAGRGVVLTAIHGRAETRSYEAGTGHRRERTTGAVARRVRGGGPSHESDTMTVAYLGPRGTFAERAARRLTESSGDELRPAASVIAALELVRSGEVDSAVVPIENSIEGSVSGTLDELSAMPALQITAEVAVPVRFTLMARTDVP